MATDDSTYAEDEGGAKLIPEWGVTADNQVVLAGLAAFVGLLVVAGWSLWRANGDGDVVSVVSSVVEQPEAVIEGESLGEVAIDGDAALVPTTVVTSTTEAAGASQATTQVAGPAVGDVQAAVSRFGVTATQEGSTAILEGFVADDAESLQADAAAAAVEGIERVENNLVVLEPIVLEALRDQGVVSPTVDGVATSFTVGGIIQSEDDRRPVLDAVAAVEGVEVIEDALEVSVASRLNALPQVQFATASAEILPVSFEDLDRAAELLLSARDVRFLVVGWTDTRGDEQANLRLSQARAEAVASYLVAAGVPADVLTPVGNGETDQFAAGDSPDALLANRVVLFEQVDPSAENDS